MSRPKLRLPLIAAALLVFFAYALVQLLLLRYQRGDVYPAYSTLRADPLGTRALYEALETTGAYKVSRGYLSLHRELGGKPGSVFYLGLAADEVQSFTKDEAAELDAYVKNGGRVVITFTAESPVMPADRDKSNKDSAGKKDSPPATKDNGAATEGDNTPPASQTDQEKYEREEFRKEREAEDKADRDRDTRTYQPSLAALWGFGWEHQGVERTKGEDGADDPDSASPEVMALRATAQGPEYKVPWKSALYFVRMEPDWQVLYYAKDRPVFIQRAWGKGQIIVASDSFFVSNEALWDERRPQLLSFLAGAPGQLLFDETHLGTEHQEGVMALAEQFRLEGYVLGMALVAGLFLWRNSVPLVPPRAVSSDAPVGGTVSGKDSRSGLVNLLRRNISPAEILKVSFHEWKRGVTPARKHLHGKMEQMDVVLARAGTQPSEIIPTYRLLREINVPSRAKGIHAAKS
jgi:hypothetical protein